MNQKQIYTDFWNLLSLTEDYLKYNKNTGDHTPPSFDNPPPAQEAVHAAASGGTFAPRAGGPGGRASAGEAVLPDCPGCSIRRAGRGAVPGRGSSRPRLLVVTGPPSVRAEQEGIPLAAEEMDYFEKWIAAIGLDLGKDVYLTNLTRCRPPGNRPPFPEEMNRCTGSIREFIRKVSPEVLLTMGPVPSAFLTGQTGLKVSEIRGQFFDLEGIPLLTTYSPDQVLSYPELKRPVWDDLKRIRNVLNGS